MRANVLSASIFAFLNYLTGFYSTYANTSQHPRLVIFWCCLIRHSHFTASAKFKGRDSKPFLSKAWCNTDSCPTTLFFKLFSCCFRLPAHNSPWWKAWTAECSHGFPAPSTRRTPQENSAQTGCEAPPSWSPRWRRTGGRGWLRSRKQNVCFQLAELAHRSYRNISISTNTHFHLTVG